LVQTLLSLQLGVAPPAPRTGRTGVAGGTHCRRRTRACCWRGRIRWLARKSPSCMGCCRCNSRHAAYAGGPTCRQSCRRSRRCTRPHCSRSAPVAEHARWCGLLSLQFGAALRRSTSRACVARVHVAVVAGDRVVGVGAAAWPGYTSPSCRGCCRCSSAPHRPRKPRPSTYQSSCRRYRRRTSPCCSYEAAARDRRRPSQGLLSLQFGAVPPTQDRRSTCPPSCGRCRRCMMPYCSYARTDAVTRVVRAPVVVVAVRRSPPTQAPPSTYRRSCRRAVAAGRPCCSYGRARDGVAQSVVHQLLSLQFGAARARPGGVADRTGAAVAEPR
jgi:hypothetical protein